MAAPIFQEYTVEGTGPFPFDMLRYDRAWPATEQDAGILHEHNSSNIRSHERYKVKVRGLRAPTKERWRSFGWNATTIANPR